MNHKFNHTPFSNPVVETVFSAYPEHIRPQMLFLRELIIETASETEGVGRLEETLKWGEPSYLTPETKSGSTVRIDWKKRNAGTYAMYFNCQTSLVHTFKELYGDLLSFEGNRSIVFEPGKDIPEDVIRHCIAMALTYHLNKKRA